MPLQKTQQASKVRYMPSGGQNKIFSPAVADRVIELLCSGKSVKEIAEDIGVNPSTLAHWRSAYPDFESRYTQAQDVGFDVRAERMRTVAEEMPDVQRARLVTEVERWILSRQAPHKYGDRISLDVNQTVDIGGALLEAKKRAALPASDLAKEVEAEVVDIKELSPNRPTGSKPAALKDKDADESASDDIFK